MVVADDRQAAEWGAEVLRKGGNAVDAAVATAFAMAVTRPHFASLGGGGFMVYCPAPGAPKKLVTEGAVHSHALELAPKPPCYALDYREEAPGAASRDMYIKDGKPRTDLSQNGALASGVPGVTAGLLAALERFGSMPRQKLLVRPIELAQKGFPFSAHEESTALDRWTDFNPETRKNFGCGPLDQGVPAKPCEPGTMVKQPDLARVLQAISAHGAKGFYEGEVASKIAQGLQASGGIMTVEDLKSYQPKWREPVHGEFRGMEVISMPPPSAGGGVLLEMLGFMERADRQGALDEGFGSARATHAIATAMSLGFADRAKHYGDPDQVHVPVQELIAPAYLDSRWKLYNPNHFDSPAGAGDPSSEGTHTTHFSVIDRDGNAVAITTTVNDNYGSGFTPPGTGVVMNDEMDDFSVQPGVPNMFGLIGGESNAIAPHKRPLSSMSPTVVRDSQGRVHLVLGASGGPTITTSVFLSILNRLRFGMSLVDAVAAPRVHQQWRPEELKFERQGYSPDTLQELARLGHKLVPKPSIAKVHAIERFPNGRTWGVPDFRAEGAAVAE